MKGLSYYAAIRNTEEETQHLRVISRWDLCKLRRRARGNMTQEEYAECCGVSAAVIGRLESREPYKPAWSSEQYEKILGVTMDFAMDHVEWPQGGNA